MQPRHGPAASQHQHSQQYGTRDSPRQGFNTRYERSAYKLFPAQAHYQRPPTPESLIQRNPNLQRSAGLVASNSIGSRSRRSNSFDEGRRNKMLPSPRLQSTEIAAASSSSTPQLQRIQNEIIQSDETRMSSAWQSIVRAKPDHVSALISQFNETRGIPAEDHGRGRSESAPLRPPDAQRQEMNQRASNSNENTATPKAESAEASRTSQVQKLLAAGLQAPGGDADFTTSSPISSSPRGVINQQQRFPQSSKDSPHSSVAPYGLGLNFDSNRTTPDLSMFPAPGFQHSTPLLASPARPASPGSYPFPRPHSPQTTPRPHSPHAVPRPHSPHGFSNMRQPPSPRGYHPRSQSPAALQSPRIRSPLHDEGRADSPIYTPPNFTSKRRFEHALRVNTAVASPMRPTHTMQQQQQQQQQPRSRSMSQPQIQSQTQPLPPQRRSPPQPQHSSPEIQQMRTKSPEVQQHQFNRSSPQQPQTAQQSRNVPEQNQKPQDSIETLPDVTEEVSTSAESESRPKVIRKSALQKPLPPPPPPDAGSMPSMHSAEDSSESSKQSPNRRSPESEPVTLSPVSPVSPISPDSRAIHHHNTRTSRGNASPVSAISKASMDTTHEAVAADAPSVPPLPKTINRKPVAKSPPTQFTNSPESPLQPPPTSRFQVKVSSPGRRPSAMDDSPAETVSPEPTSGSVRSPDLNDSPVRVENARSVVIVGGSAENHTPGHRKNTSVVLTPSVITISENSRSSASSNSIRPDSSSLPGTPIKFQGAALVSTPSRPTSEKLQNISEKQESGVEQEGADLTRNTKPVPDVKRADIVDTANNPNAAPASRVQAARANIESKSQSSGLSKVLTLEQTPPLSSSTETIGRTTPRNDDENKAETILPPAERAEIVRKQSVPELRPAQNTVAEATKQLASISEQRTDSVSQPESKAVGKSAEEPASALQAGKTSTETKDAEVERLAFSARSIFERAKAAAAAATAAYAAENEKSAADSQEPMVTTPSRTSPTKSATQPTVSNKEESPQSPATVEASELALRLAAAEKMHFASQAIMTPEKANSVLQQITEQSIPVDTPPARKESLPVQMTARKESLAAQPSSQTGKPMPQSTVRKEILTALPAARKESLPVQTAVKKETMQAESKNSEKPALATQPALVEKALSEIAVTKPDKPQVEARKVVEPTTAPSSTTALPQVSANVAPKQPDTSSVTTSQPQQSLVVPEKKAETIHNANLQPPPSPQSRAVSPVSPLSSPSSVQSDRPKPQSAASYKKFFMQEDVFFAQPMIPTAPSEAKKESAVTEVEPELSVEDLPKPRLSMRRSASPASSHRTELAPVIEEESPEIVQAPFPAPKRPAEITHVRTDSAGLRTRRMDSIDNASSINTPDTPADPDLKKEEPRQIPQQPIPKPVEAVEQPRPRPLIDSIPPIPQERPTSSSKRPKTPKTPKNFEPTARTFDDIIGADSPRNRSGFRPAALLQSVGKFARLANNSGQASNNPAAPRVNDNGSRPSTPAFDGAPVAPPPADALARFADRDERSPRPRDSSPRPRGSDPVLSAALTSNPPNDFMTRDGPVIRERGSLTGEATPAAAKPAEKKDAPVEQPVKPRVVSDLPPPVPRKDTVRIQRKVINVVDESPIVPPAASAIPPATASSLRGESRGSDVSTKDGQQETNHTRDSSDRSANSSIDLKAIRARVAGISQRTAKAVEAPAKDEESLLAALEELNKTSEALHDRYADLKMERVKLSAAFLAALKDRNQGPEHTESILAQHAALASIASSMDICFAKLKSVDCQKEESITALRSQLRRKPSSASVRTGRASSKTRQQGLVPSRGPSDATTAVDRSDSLDKNKLENVAAQAKDAAKLTVKSDSAAKSVQTEAPKIAGSPKKDTARDDSTAKKNDGVKQDEVDAEEAAKARRIKGVKAAKVLGLADEKDITLPDSLDKQDTSRLVVTIGPVKQAKATAGPAPQRPLPAAPPSKRRSIVDSVHASIMSFATTPSDQDNWTPNEEMVMPNVLKGPVNGRDVRVYADDDLLEYYHNAP